MVDATWTDMLKTVNGIQFKYSSFVNQTSALNVSAPEEELPFNLKNQSLQMDFISSQS